MAELTCKIELSGVETMRELLGILADNFDELPEPVRGALQALSDGEGLVWDSKYLLNMGADPANVTVVADGEVIGAPKALHPFSREVELGDGTRIKATCAEIRNKDGNGIRGWA